MFDDQKLVHRMVATHVFGASGGGAGEAFRHRTPPASSTEARSEKRRGELEEADMSVATASAAFDETFPCDRIVEAQTTIYGDALRIDGAGRRPPARATPRRAHPMPRRPRTHRASGSAGNSQFSPQACDLLKQAKHGLVAAQWETIAADRFAAAYLAALRGAAAMLALRGRPHRRRAKPTSAWVLLAALAPELAQWAEFFDSMSATNAAIQSGITRGATSVKANELVRGADQFLELVAMAVPGA